MIRIVFVFDLIGVEGAETWVNHGKTAYKRHGTVVVGVAHLSNTN